MTHKGITLIGITGYAGTGKDTVRTMLEQKGFTGLAFADPIRAMLRTLLRSSGLNEAYMDSRALKERTIPELDVSYRHLAQTLGTEWGRAVQADLWLRLAANKMMMASREDAAAKFVISDVRFANEADFVRQLGGQIWRIERADTPSVRDHVSEREIDSLKVDQYIHNNGSLADLYSTVAGALRVLS
jgi:hypothetical protein